MKHPVRSIRWIIPFNSSEVMSLLARANSGGMKYSEIRTSLLFWIHSLMLMLSLQPASTLYSFHISGLHFPLLIILALNLIPVSHP